MAQFSVNAQRFDPYNSMLKFFAVDTRLRRVVAVSTGRTPASALAPSIFVGPLGQLPPSLYGIPTFTAVETQVLCSIMSLTN
jgi:hypothetical protein